MKIRIMMAAAASALAGSVWAEAVPASIFNSHMVLQQDCKVPIWGKADPGERVSVEFAGQTVKTVASANGVWIVRLEPMEASAKPQTMTINSVSYATDEPIKSQLTFFDVLVGEVWLCSGQSNMSMPMWAKPYVGQHGNRDVNGYFDALLTDELEIRGVSVPSVWSVKEKELDRRLDWRRFATGEQQHFSAIAFHYAKILHDALKVPVGVIVSAWGGTNIETWISPDGYRSVKGLEGLAEKEILAKDPNAEAPTSDAQDAKRPTAAAKRRKLELHKQPRALWNAMIHPLVPFALRGATWYQGESNRGQGLGYKDYLHALYNGWSMAFGIRELPFYIVQIAPYDYGCTPEQPAASVCDIWQAEAEFAHEIPNGGCAVTVDVGEHDNIHPGDKRTVAMRLAVLALNKAYGRKEVPCESPELKSATVEKGVVNLAFERVDKWTMHGTDPANFEVAGPDGVWHRAKSELRPGGLAKVWADGVSDPRGVRYLWNWCWNGRLKNDYGLPLGPFKKMLDAEK